MNTTLSPELYTQIRAFLRTTANTCSSCMRRNTAYCHTCGVRMAKVLDGRMDESMPVETAVVDTSLNHRMEIILKQLREAKQPLRAIDIDTQNYCSKLLKHWTLNKLIKEGKIKRQKHGFFYKYSLVESKQQRKHK